MTEQQPRALTFGIEFEFLVAVPPNKSSQISDSPDSGKIHFPSPDNWKDCADLIASTLTAHGIPTSRLEESFARQTPGSWHITDDASISATKDEITPFWPAGEKNPYNNWGFEIISPVLTAPLPSSCGNVAGNNDFQQVLQVTQILTTNFRTFCNRSTGLHIHVGDGPRGFPFSTVQKLVAFLYTFEPSIASLHPAHRQALCDERGERTFCQPLRSFPLPRLVGCPGVQVLDELLAVTDIKALGLLVLGFAHERGTGRLNKTRYGAYNLSGLCRPNGLKTVEFRQHEGTLDGERVVLWAAFCVALIELAGRVDVRNLRTYLCREITAEEGTGKVRSIADVCHVLGFAEGMRAWGEVGEEEALSRLDLGV